MSHFKLVSKPLGNIERFFLKKDDGSEFEILSGFGCGLNGWKAPVYNSLNTRIATKLKLLYGYESESELRKICNDTNAGCRLTPFAGRTAYAKFTWDGTTYNLINNVSWAPHALHGFLQNKAWQLDSYESENEYCMITFSCDWPGAFTGFPFPFRAKNVITFTGKSFTVISSVTNIGTKPMPYSEGFHPYYMLGEKIDNLKLTLPRTSLSILDESDIPIGSFKQDMRFEHGRKIYDEFINDCFCLESEISNLKATDSDIINNVHTILENSKYTLDIWQRAGQEQYNAIQIYTPPNRESIAIEPMTAEPDVLNHHRGLIIIKPNETKTFEFGAKLSQK